MSVPVEDAKLNEAQQQAWGLERELGFSEDNNPWNGTACDNVYSHAIWDNFLHNAPLDNQIVKSHQAWVSNTRAWNGVSTKLQAPIEQVPNYWGLSRVGLNVEPVPQNPNSASLTQMTPTDLLQFVDPVRRRTGDPVISPCEMNHCVKTGVANYCPLPFSMYGF